MALQMSFFSAEATRPRVADLAGLLCGPGQTAVFAKATARLMVPVEDAWRARALVAACAERGVRAQIRVEDDARTLCTAFRADLGPLAAAWSSGVQSGGTHKTVPGGFTPDGATLRMWVLAAGRWVDSGYLLPLDPAAPQTHEPLLDALGRCGLPATMLAGGSGVKIIGRRRLGRLSELVGPPVDAGCGDHWPAVSRMRVVS
ncbi:hypothetical protein [Alloactinosynnema sp. L-07]|uniref:hypothetical protein n=1 Tax=Alloactinosynnema sp. L-07 TaxID=1653480 RepID=UPI00065EF4DF|nr:hypothetical protein [Alloactinosynnema sp. L-07]CRK61086.1 hypothetical protein [Alloactinosynnema sp. L-07]